MSDTIKRAEVVDISVLTRLRTAEADAVVCRAVLDVPDGVPLAEKVRQMKATLEQAQKQFGNCSICGYAAWKNRDGDANVEECQYCKLSKAAAEMREALLRIPCPNYGPQISWGATQQDPMPRPCGYCEVCLAHKRFHGGDEGRSFSL